MKATAFNRRALLRAAGLTLCVPAFLREAFADPEESGPRLLILMQPNGTEQLAFWPDPITGTSPILEPLFANDAIKQKTALVRGIKLMTTGPGNQHDLGFTGLWTGVNPVGRSEACFAGGPSIDQILKRELGPRRFFPTLNVGVLAAEVPAKNAHRTSFSYLDARQPIPTQTDPRQLFANLFPEPGVSDQTAALQTRMAMRKSVLDYVARDLSDLERRLGPTERKKLDAHATALREYEQRLSLASAGPGAACARPDAPDAELDPHHEDSVPLLTELMSDLVVAALSCNLTQIVTYQLGYCGVQWRCRWLGIDKDTHDEIAHHSNDANPETHEAMTKISHWYAEQVARIANGLDNAPDANDNGTVLDNSLVVWANENATGFHSLDPLPVALIGRAGGRLTKSGLIDQGEQPHYRLGTTILNLMGVQASGFGDAPDCGSLSGVS
ncbi:MAG: DUF1552 domain-containing protein [Myxococcota bacterium]|nr:DUF1552 domain-containing protein [Myxococcota bacterium]